MNGTTTTYSLGTRTIKAYCPPIARMLNTSTPDDGHQEYGGAIEKHCPSKQRALRWLAVHLSEHHSQGDRIEPEVRLTWLINSRTVHSASTSRQTHHTSMSEDVCCDQQVWEHTKPVETNEFKIELIHLKIEATCVDLRLSPGAQNYRHGTCDQFHTLQQALDWIANRLHGGTDSNAKIVQTLGAKISRNPS